ncbi:helix-turn-helix domain-containing protein [Klebsiella quasipneumoniae]|uniref:winged helix-turn-helix transcriptional regulator n=1 Tax=Klebsiella quasipneumoniae TaxID=1463165 RepID=UPI000C7CC46C|nr:winged helix-turn-helix transcriptional regulator [Klebsiella quasipneumoniae]EJR0356443.1 helix-turn-helix domain-containing protein [Klebsiella quasipneumoniae]EKV4333771.1 helix-turn-helix domain-containing protein [Klebsiella quasipneumoniae]PLJ39188.1 cytoplasmic protein [Klebsiella quasipneumoniae]PLJ58986.1 cytoplasmic protein [Klebsiella quasipneumoniae]
MSKPDANGQNSRSLPSFFYGRRTKPLTAVESLLSAFRPVSTPFELAQSNYYHFPLAQSESGFILLEEGVASVCFAENQLVISTVLAPAILGLIDNYGVFNGLPDIRHSSLFAETDLSGRWIAHQAAVNILNEKNLWQEMAHILTQRLMVLSMRERELLGVDSYQMVRILLMELAVYSETYRRQINVLRFIQRRTNLSRSRIMSILSELRKGGYIIIHRGVLMTIAQPLPANF